MIKTRIKITLSTQKAESYTSESEHIAHKSLRIKYKAYCFALHVVVQLS